MEVILKEDIRSLGKAGEVVKVSEGHGRNFLLPQKKAILATPGNLKTLESQKKSIEAKREKDRTEAEVFGQKVSSLTITLEKQAGEENKIFGSVTIKEIVDLLKAQEVVVDKRSIEMKIPIRTVGEHTVDVHLHGDVVVPLKIQVIKK